MAAERRITLVSMSGLRVVDPQLLELGLRLPGLATRASALSELPPLGLLTLASTVPENWLIEFVSDDGLVEEQAVIQEIAEFNPEVVAFSSLTPAVDRAARLSQSLRKRGITTLLGGLHATAALDLCEIDFDSIAVGDGEELLPEMLRDWESGDLNQQYRPASPFDLSRSPPVRWDLWGSRSVPRYTLQTMRGCPWACQFCAASRLLGPARTKPLPNIQAEMSAITSRQPRPWIELADDNTFASDRDHEGLLAALGEAGARWFTESDWRIGLRPDLLRQIAASGCRQILVGLESSVFRYRGMGAKTAAWDEMLDACRAIQEAGIVVNACLIVGADGETRESIDQLGEFLETAPFGEIQLTLQTPFPGTNLYDEFRRTGRLLPGDFSRYTLFDVVYQPDQLSPNDLQSTFNELISRVFRPELQQRRNHIVKHIRSARRGSS